MTDRAITAEPRWITEHMLLAIHSQQVERYGGLHGVLDQNVILSALARPVNRWAYDETADWADLAAGYLVGYARTQGFNDGNKRTALACAMVFLELNGIASKLTRHDLDALILATQDGGLSEVVLERLVQERMR